MAFSWFIMHMNVMPSTTRHAIKVIHKVAFIILYMHDMTQINARYKMRASSPCEHGLVSLTLRVAFAM